MENNILTVERVAAELNLHPKTIRRFIQEGKLKAHKIGKQWRISKEDLQSFVGHNNTTAEPNGQQISNNTDDTFENAAKQKIQVSTVVDIFVEDAEEAIRITNTIFAILNCKDPSYKGSRCDHVFYKDELKARFILWGSPLFISHILESISVIVENKS